MNYFLPSFKTSQTLKPPFQQDLLISCRIQIAVIVGFALNGPVKKALEICQYM